MHQALYFRSITYNAMMFHMQWVQFFVEKLLSWPVIAFVLIVLLRKPVIALLGRESLKLGIGKEGLVLTANIQSEGQPVPKGLAETKGEKVLSDARSVIARPIVNEQVSGIQAALKELNLGQAEQIDVLVKHLAVTQLALRFESVYRTIYGSQIAILKLLNTSGATAKSQLQVFYETAKAQFPIVYESYSFDQYLQYLVTQGLIRTEDYERYVITVAGQEFLMWMTSMGIAESKSF